MYKRWTITSLIDKERYSKAAGYYLQKKSQDKRVSKKKISRIGSVQKRSAKYIILFVYSIKKKMSENALKFNNIRVNKKESHKSKETIDLDSVNIDQMVLSDKFKHSDKSFKYFIGYQKGEMVKPLCIILPQMMAYRKYFEDGGKNMSYLIKDDKVRKKYEEIWSVIKNKLGIKFHGEPIYEQKYLKA